MSIVNYLKYAYPDLLYHPYIGSQGDIDSFSALDNVKLLQLSTDMGVSGTNTAGIVKAGCLPYTNSLGTYDNNMLAAGNFTGIDAMTANGVRIIQTNYTDILGPYLKSKGLR